jgi:hypothetical protein
MFTVRSGTMGDGYISSIERVYVMARASKREPRAGSTPTRKRQRV